MPARGTRRRLLLDQDAQAFEPSRTYPEAAVNEVLKTIFDDYCALRRYLVDEVFLSRTAAGTYWRAGGTVGYRVPYVARRYVPIRRAPAADPLMSVPDRQC